MYRYIPRNYSNAEIGLLVVLLAIVGGAISLYNAYRMGRLPWKPKGPANPRRVALVILASIILIFVLMVLVEITP